MELTLFTEGYFDAAHFIENHEGQCAFLHGHTWKVCVWVRGDSSMLDDKGILWDFGNLKNILKEFDHKNLNDILPVNPTAENLVLHIYGLLKKGNVNLKYKVRVYESISSKESYCIGGDDFAV